MALQNSFPELTNSVVPVLRKTQTKFKKTAIPDIKAVGKIGKDSKVPFLQQFERKDRASIVVSVEVSGEMGIVSMEGEYEWFVTKQSGLKCC